MLSKQEVIRKMQGFECPQYLQETCYKPIQEQALLAIELQARLDKIEAVCLDEMVGRDMAERNFAYGYNYALAKTMKILRGE